MNDVLDDFFGLHAGLQRPPGRPGMKTAAMVRNFSGLPWLPLRLSGMPHEQMLAEARALKECFLPHRSSKEDHKGWKSLCIHGLSSVHTGPHSRYGFSAADAPYGWTDICKFCPATLTYFRDVFGYAKYHRVRFMLLEPDGYILPHVDSTVDHLEAVNIALNNPEQCEFVMEGCGTVPFAPGTAMMLSLSRHHAVRNRSAEDRYHVIVHGIPDQGRWDTIVMDSYTETI